MKRDPIVAIMAGALLVLAGVGVAAIVRNLVAPGCPAPPPTAHVVIESASPLVWWTFGDVQVSTRPPDVAKTPAPSTRLDHGAGTWAGPTLSGWLDANARELERTYRAHLDREGLVPATSHEPK